MNILRNLRRKLFGFGARIYMKSGNVIVLTRLESLQSKRQDNGLVGLEWKFNKRGTQRILYADVGQVEAIIIDR